MNIEEILREYDAMYGRNTLTEVEAYLMQKVDEAKNASEAGALFTLLNEAVGFFRDTTQKEKALRCCDELLALMEIMRLRGSYEYATALLNIANAYRAFGLFGESLAFFETTLEIYRAKVPAGDFSYANLYNNWSLLYQEMEEYGKAAEMLEQALEVVNVYEGAVMQQAITHSNLAASLLQVGTEGAYQSALEHLRIALDIFEADGGQDFHYGAALVAMGDAYSVKKQYGKAAEYYGAGLKELEKHVGKTDNYMRVLEKYQYAKGFAEQESVAVAGNIGKKPWKSNLERSREFYEQYGAPMIHELFPEYEERIAVGLVGEGSDCYGFDDEISTDHDYEVGFCMWLTEEDYKEIGGRLQEAYAELITEEVWGEKWKQTVKGMHGSMEAFGGAGRNRFLSGRRGVFTINDFYNRLLGTRVDYEAEVANLVASVERETVSDAVKDAEHGMGQLKLVYGHAQEFQLAAATNGAVFRDDLEIFNRVRAELLSYYPEKIWYEKLAQALHEYAQYAQSNYARMMAREDLITANLCIGKAVEAAMDLLYLLQRRYAPYYKWKRKGLEQGPRDVQEAALSQGIKGQALSQDVKVQSQVASQKGGQVVRSITIEAVLALLNKIVALSPRIEAWENVVYDSTTLNLQDECVCLFEQVAELLLQEMKRQRLVDGEDVFLENYVGQLMYGAQRNALPACDGKKGTKAVVKKEDVQEGDAVMSDTNTKNVLVERIVQLEWEQFDKVKNEGGRADCQDNFPTFSIMRKSQYLAWPEELLTGYCNDLIEAKNTGWNLIMEKYARMMKSTAPAKYAELESELPVRSPERTAIAEEVIKIQVGWMEDFAARYPKMADNARSIRTEDDTEYNTSYETYLRGELGTYSENTFVLYARFIVGLAQSGRNLAYDIMSNTAHLYGYESVEDAESKL